MVLERERERDGRLVACDVLRSSSSSSSTRISFKKRVNILRRLICLGSFLV